MSDLIRISKHGSTTIISINRPQVRNAINHATAQALRQAWADFDADPEARVGILTGEGGTFCAGADLKDMPTMADDFRHEDAPLGFTRMMVSKPTIAAIAGYAVAGGLECACWCDLRIGDETAVLGCFERRFGVPLVDGGNVRLPQIVGLGRALELILTGRSILAPEALAWGLLNEVVPAGQALTRALQLAEALAQFPQVCMNNDRRAVYAALGQPLDEALRIEAHIGAETIASGETLRGAQAFSAGKGRGGSFA